MPQLNSGAPVSGDSSVTAEGAPRKGQDVNPDSVSYLLELGIGTAANAYLSHASTATLRCTANDGVSL